MAAAIDLVQMLPAGLSVSMPCSPKPILYVFPGGNEDSALVALHRFSLLLDGGDQREVPSWTLIKNYDCVSAVLASRPSAECLRSLTSIFARKQQTQCAPTIGAFIGNLPSCGAVIGDSELKSALKTIHEGLNIDGAIIYNATTNLKMTPITLYEVVGKGALRMTVLNPEYNCNDLETIDEAITADIGVEEHSGRVSLAVVLIWHPFDRSKPTIRILYPGACPLEKLYAALEKIKDEKCLRRFDYISAQHEKLIGASKSSKPNTKAGALMNLHRPRPSLNIPGAITQKPASAGRLSTIHMGGGATAMDLSRSTIKQTVPASHPGTDAGKVTSHVDSFTTPKSTEGETSQTLKKRLHNNTGSSNFKSGGESKSKTVTKARDGSHEKSQTAVKVLVETHKQSGHIVDIKKVGQSGKKVARTPVATTKAAAKSGSQSEKKPSRTTAPVRDADEAAIHRAVSAGRVKTSTPKAASKGVGEIASSKGVTVPNKRIVTSDSATRNDGKEVAAAMSYVADAATHPIDSGKQPNTKASISNGGGEDNGDAGGHTVEAQNALEELDAKEMFLPPIKEVNRPRASVLNSPKTGLPSKPPLSHPLYFDVVFLPHHGAQPTLTDKATAKDFATSIRSKRYIFSGKDAIKRFVMNGIVEAKTMWDMPDVEISVIPTHESEELTAYNRLKAGDMSKAGVNLRCSAERCTLKLLNGDKEDTCAGIRFEF